MKNAWTFATVLVLSLTVLSLVGFRSQQNNFDKITVREFELVDDHGHKRASIKVEPEGGVVFRLMDSQQTIRVKIGADTEGSGIVLLDGNTNPGVHMLAKKQGSTLSIMDKEGKKKEY